MRELLGGSRRGDILVFMPSERDIQETCTARTAAGGFVGDRAVVRSVERGRTATGVRSTGVAAGGGGDEHRGDLVHRAADSLRGGHRVGPDQPVPVRHAVPSTAHRAHFAEQCQSTQGPVRPGQRRRLHPALRGGGFPGAARVHTSRDRTLQPGRSGLAFEGLADGGG